MDVPDVSYARSGDVAIAYQVVGEGPTDIVFVRGTLADLLAGWDMPLFVDHVEGLARSARAILFDKRGSGLSDPVRQVPTLETRMDDIRAVMDAADSERAVLWAAQEGTRIALLFAATYPERTTALVLYDPTARGLWAPDYPWAPNEDAWRKELREIRDRWGDRDYLVERAHRLSPVGAENEAWLAWFVWYMRRSASPAEAVAFHRMSMEGDVREILDAVRAPTLVLHRSETTDEASYVTERIRGARRMEVKGLHDWFSWADPEHNAVLLRRRTSSSTTSRRRLRRTACWRRSSSPTSSARPRGRQSWETRPGGSCSLAITRSCAASWSASAAMSSIRPATASSLPSTAPAGDRVRAAIREALRALDIEIRAGLHTGECERVDGKLGGIAVPTGARIASLAEPGEVLVSSTVRDLVAGSEIEFEERGTHELKGIPGEWRLFAVR